MTDHVQTNELNTIDARTTVADNEFESYDFGKDVIVVGQESWDKNERDDLTKVVYVEFLDDRSDSSSKVSFHVRFGKSLEVAEVYGLLVSNGEHIGHRSATHNGKSTMSKSTSADTLKAVKATEIEKVTAAFLAEIEKEGIVKTFEWMSPWFDTVARSQINDEVEDQVAGYENQKQAKSLYLAGLIGHMASGINNQSTMESANIMRRSRLSAAAGILERCNAYSSKTDRLKAWDLLIEEESKLGEKNKNHQKS